MKNILTGITDGFGDFGHNLTVTAVSDNPALVPPPAIIYNSPSSTGTLILATASGDTGTATITVTVQDDGGTANGSLDTTT